MTKTNTETNIIEKNVKLVNVSLSDYVFIGHNAELSEVTIGLRSSIGKNTKIKSAQIGKYCSISFDSIIGAPNHSIKAVSTNSFYLRKKFGLCDNDILIEQPQVIIGNDVWIGCNSVVLAGINIGDGSIIGAGAVVTHDVLPYEIVGGVPAKHIHFRFNTEIIERLKKIEWWNFPDDVIKKNIDFFSSFINLENNIDIMAKLEIIANEIKQEKEQ